MKSLSGLYEELENASRAVDNAVREANAVERDKGSYYYTETIRWNEKKSYLGGIFKKVTHYETIPCSRNEIRFDANRFNDAVARARAKIEAKQQEVSRVVDQVVVVYKQQEVEVKQKLSMVRSEVSSIKSNVSSLYSNIQSVQSYNKSLSNEIYSCNNGVKDLERQKGKLQSEISDLELQMSNLRDECQKNQDSIKALQGRVLIDQSGKDSEEAQLKAKMEDVVNSMDEARRADLIIKLWNSKDKRITEMIELVVAKGFDVNYQDALGHSILSNAVLLGDMSLFDLVIERYPDYNLELPSINGMTLLEYSVVKDKDDFSSKLFNSCSDFGRTALRALKSNNVKLLEKIFEHCPSEISAMHQGHSLLHLAVLSNRVEVIEAIVKADSSAMDLLNCKGDSCFSMALKYSSAETIKSLIKHVDIAKQMSMLIKNSQLDELASLFEASPDLIDSLDASVLCKAIENKQSDLARMLIDYGFDSSSAIEIMVNQNNKNSLVALHGLDVDYLLNSKFDKKILISKFMDLGCSAISHEISAIVEASGNVADDATYVTGI